MPDKPTPRTGRYSATRFTSDELLRGAGVEIVYQDDEHLIATFQNVIVTVWGTRSTVATIEHLDSAAHQLWARHPTGISSLHLILHSEGMPDGAARAALNKLTDVHAPHLACVATLVQGSGFWASAMRGLLTSLHFLVRRPFKARICASLEEMASWLVEPHARMTGVTLERDAVCSILQVLAQRMTPIAGRAAEA